MLLYSTSRRMPRGRAGKRRCRLRPGCRGTACRRMTHSLRCPSARARQPPRARSPAAAAPLAPRSRSPLPARTLIRATRPARQEFGPPRPAMRGGRETAAAGFASGQAPSQTTTRRALVARTGFSGTLLPRHITTTIPRMFTHLSRPQRPHRRTTWTDTAAPPCTNRRQTAFRR